MRHHLIILFLIYALQGVSQQLDFKNIESQPAAECFYVLQDSKGYIWFSTSNGLCKYNGATLKRFSLNNGMPDNVVFDLFEDSKGRLLFNTSIGKMGYIKNDSVFTCRFNDQLKDILHNGRGHNFNIYEDSNHYYWLSTTYGLYKTVTPGNLDKLTKVEYKCDSCLTGINVIDGKKILISHVWIKKNSDDLARFPFYVKRGQNVNLLSYTMDAKTMPSFNKSLLLRNGDILLSVHNKVLVIEPNGNYTVKTFEDAIICLYEDKDEGVWLGLRNKGLLYFKTNFKGRKGISSLNQRSVSMIMEDKEGGIWASTLEKGIFYCASKHVIDYSNNDGLGKKISALALINNKIFVNDFSTKLSCIENDSPKNLEIPIRNSGLNDIYYIGNKLYAASSLGLLQTDSVIKAWKEMKAKGSYMLYNLSASSDGRLYGLNHAYVYEVKNGGLDILDTLPSRGKCICVLTSGKCLIGCINGLYTYDLDKHRYNFLGNQTKLFSDKINCIKENNNGEAWILSSTGIAIINSRGVIHELDWIKRKLGDLNCRDVCFNKSEAFVATDKGLILIRIGDQLAELFDKRHGLIDADLQKVVLRQDELWIGSGSGLYKIEKRFLHRNTSIPVVYISNIYMSDNIVSKSIFKYNENSLRFIAEGLSYMGHKCTYQYRLIGSDTVWHYSNSNEIAFNSLKPGNYTFEIKARNADGFVSEHAARFSFNIDKPFWLKWWFILLEVIVGGLLIWLFIAYRLRTLRKKEEEQAKVSTLIAEYQVAALRSQMNPHFIFNAINSIQRYVMENNPKTAYDYLGKFARLIRMVLNHSKDQKISLMQELEMLKLYVDLEQLRFDDFKFELEIDETIEKNIFLPTMLLQPYVENAIWHGLMNLKGKRVPKLKIAITEKNNQTHVIIEDNGVGRAESERIKKNETHHSMGMELNKKRMELMNKLPEGEKVEILVTDIIDTSGSVCGTKVDIKIESEYF